MLTMDAIHDGNENSAHAIILAEVELQLTVVVMPDDGRGGMTIVRTVDDAKPSFGHISLVRAASSSG